MSARCALPVDRGAQPAILANMQGRFVTWGIGALCLPLIAVSAFVLVVPEHVDNLWRGAMPEPADPPVPRVERVPVSLGPPDCAVVGHSGLTALRLDGKRVELGAGTVLEGVMSTRGRGSYRARILNGPHVDEKIELGWQSPAQFWWQWDWRAPLWACNWAAEAELDGLWIDAHGHAERLAASAEDEVAGVLWADADEETSQLMRWAAQAPQRARWRADDALALPRGNDHAFDPRGIVWAATSNAANYARWLERFGEGDPSQTSDGKIAALP
ncbi:MAG: hypothetical protein WKG00_27920 [Polyangiaceae bacterium]